MKKNIAFIIFNFIGLQATWAACAYGATHAMPMLGFYVGLSYVVSHFMLCKMRTRDVKIMLIIGALGILIDSTLTQINILSFAPHDTEYLLLPYWLIALWFVFALMVPYSLNWLSKNLKIACIAGAIGGSFSYFLGHKLGALELAEPLAISLGIYFIIWGILFPLTLKIVEHFTQTRLDTETAKL
jgi:uncharacterized membrane protein YjjB (DUF3815 family)